MRQWQFICEQRQKKNLTITFQPSGKDAERLQELAATCNRNEDEFRERYRQYLEYPLNSKNEFENEILNKGHPLYGFVYFYDKMDGKEKTDLQKYREEKYAKIIANERALGYN